MPGIRKNKTLAVAIAVLRTMCTLCASGTLFQTFLAHIGFDASQIYLQATLVQAVNVTTILLFSHYADTRRPNLRSAFAMIPQALLFLAFLPFCFGESGGVTAFLLLTAFSLLQSVCTALCTVCDYKLPYYLYRRSDYATLQALIGVLSAIVTFAVGELLGYLQRTVPYARLMLFMFLVAAAFLLLAALLTLLYTITLPEGEAEKEKPVKVPAWEVLRRPVFYLLLPANLLRGFASGVTLVFATVAISLGFGTELSPRMVSLSAVANLVACLVFGLVSRRLSPRISVLGGSLCFLLMPLCLFGSPTLFLVAYTVITFGRCVVDVAVPSLLLYAVDADIAGPYNAFRMILHTGGSLLATAVAPMLSPAALLITALACSLFSGVTFFGLRLLRDASPLRLQK